MDQTELNQKLWDATEAGNCADIRRLIVSGADLNAKDEVGRNAFQIASHFGNSDAMTTILAAKQMLELEKMGVTGAEALRMMDKGTEDLIKVREA